MKRVCVVLFLAAVWLMQPTAASAHVGSSSPVAVDDRARVTSIEPPRPPFEVRVVDGDQDLWAQVEPGNDLVILGTIREPFLHFSHAGVSVNLRSPTAQSDLFGVIPSRTPDLNPRAHPIWQKVSSTTTYLWHDHRLHALALLNGGGTARKLGVWTVPLRLNGRQGQITGELSSLSPPNRWFWLLLSFSIAVSPGLLLWRRTPLVRISGPLLAVVTTVSILVGRAGRDLFGRPDVATARYVSLVVGLILGALALDRLIRGGEETRSFVAMIVGVIGVVQGLTFLPTFWHGLVLAVTPGWVERLCAALSLGGGAASLIVCFTGARVEFQANSSPLPGPGTR
jgi:hypothetical protein